MSEHQPDNALHRTSPRNRIIEHQQTHTIKGASANVGGVALREAAFELEKAGKAGNLEAAKAGISRLEIQFEILEESIEKHF